MRNTDASQGGTKAQKAAAGRKGGKKSSIIIQCQLTGPNVIYARFPKLRARDESLQRSPPTSRYCTAGRDVVVDGLDSGFRRLCEQLGGQIRSSCFTAASVSYSAAWRSAA